MKYLVKYSPLDHRSSFIREMAMIIDFSEGNHTVSPKHIVAALIFWQQRYQEYLG